MRRAQQARAQVAAQRQKDAGFQDFQRYQKLGSETGVHFVPQLQASAQQTRDAMLKVAEDSTLSREQKSVRYQELADKHNMLAKAGTQADKYLLDTANQVTSDKRYDHAKTQELLYNTLYQHSADGSLQVGEDGKPAQVSAMDFDPRTAQQVLSQGNGHLVAPEIYGQFLDNIPEQSVSYSREALPGGRGYKSVAKSDIYELTPDGKIRRDPKTNRAVLRDSQETLAAFDSDKLNKQWLDGQLQQHQQLVTQAAAKTQRSEALTSAEQEALQLEQSPAGARMELFKKDLMRYGYAREETNLLQKAARSATGRTQGPKFARVGGTEYSPELVGGTAAGGTKGLLALASADPLGRVKPDGTVQAHTARATHRQYILLQNGQPAHLVTNNVEPQHLSYEKQQLYLTTPTGNVVTPKDETLLQRYQAGDKQPLLDWTRAQREAHPGYAVRWHFLATPATEGKLTGQNNAAQIYQRLVEDRDHAHLAPGQAGYKGNDELQSTAQKLAREQGGTLLIPYTGEDKRRIDLATGYLLRDKNHQRQMQAQYDYFNDQTAPRPAEQRPAAKKLGIDFGTQPPTTAPTPSTPALAPFKRAGTKKTGISF